MNQSIEIHIEELVLHQFSPHDRHRIGDALQAALHQQFLENGLPDSLKEGNFIAHIDAGNFQMTSTSRPAQIGAGIAGTLFSGLSNES